MAFKNVTFRRKMFLVFGSLIGLMVMVTVVTLLGIGSEERQRHKVAHYQTLEMSLTRKILDHFIWVNQVFDAIIDENKTALDVELDDHKCPLGQWLYGQEREALEENHPELKDALKKLETFNFNLHAGARKIDQIVAKKTPQSHLEIMQESLALLTADCYPALHAIEKELSDMAAMIKEKRHDAALSMDSTMRSTKITVLLIATFMTILGVIVSIWLARYVMAAIKTLQVFSERLAQGDFTARLDMAAQDEFGSLAGSMKMMATKLGDIVSAIVHEIVGLASSSNSLYSISNQLAEGAGGMTERSFAVAAAAEEMSVNMNSVAAASEQSSTSITTVAGATEEMSVSVKNIADNLEKARAISREAVTKAHDASEKVRDLGSAALDITKVTEAINEISEQTNLLALNATIEAARAGEAGKGFAVVANEIKELARQTAQATEDIKDKVRGIQESTDDTSAEINEISKVIDDVDEIVRSVAQSVDEQNIATDEIAGNVSQASLGIQEVNENVSQCSTVADEVAKDIGHVSGVSEDIKKGSENVKENARDLADFASKIKSMMAAFKVEDGEPAHRTNGDSNGSHIPNLVAFDDAIRLGISDIDDQHKNLVDLINRLHKSMKLRQGKKQAEAVLNELVEYTVVHFAYEEKRMKECGYKGLADHIPAHRELVAKVKAFQASFGQGNAMLSMDLMEFLKNWLVHHIQGIDRKYAPTLKEKSHD